jgi:small subunit ribosomal protein S15
MIKKDKKQDIIKKLGKHESDTGSARVQVGLLTEQINQLAKHLKKNKKDNHSRRGLLQMVADRRSHLKYLQKKDKKGYEEIVKKLALK